MKKFKVLADGSIEFEGNFYTKQQITPDVLYEVFRLALKQEIEFEINETDPISVLFNRIKEETCVDSVFYNEINDSKVNYKNVVSLEENIKENNIIEDLPF